MRAALPCDVFAKPMPAPTGASSVSIMELKACLITIAADNITYGANMLQLLCQHNAQAVETLFLNSLILKADLPSTVLAEDASCGN